MQVVVNPGQQCSSVDGTELGELRYLGVRTWGSRLGGHTEMITGTHQMHSEVGRRLLDALSAVLIRSADTALVNLLSAEMAGTGLAQELVLDRILDLFLLSVLRAWLHRRHGRARAGFRARCRLPRRNGGSPPARGRPSRPASR